MGTRRARKLVTLLVLLVRVVPAHAVGSFVNFESGHVRPLALSPDGQHLFAVNTPDDRLEVFAIGAGTLTSLGEVRVGLEPVAVAARTDTEVWVVNHLSDSVSVVDVSDPAAPRVMRTLQTGDEPRDLVFARADRSRAFVTAAHRGQSRPGDPQLTTPGVGRADVWVFDAIAPDATPTILTLFADTPRALAVTPDGGTVYAAAFLSGNGTTSITEQLVSANGGLPPPDPPNTSTPAPGLVCFGTPCPPPATGLIVQWDGAHWVDEIARDWSSQVRFTLPDKDVFRIDAATLATTAEIAHVGTVLFDMAVNPADGRLYVSNLDARNAVRFEPNIHGHVAENRITVIDGTTPVAHHLNPHIDYGVTPGSAAEKARSLAFPLGMAFNGDGSAVYVAAFGSAKVAKLVTADLEAGTITASQIPVGGGPTGVVFDGARDQLYVMNRFDETIAIVATATDTVVGSTALRFDPSPPAVRVGRRRLYDASTSGHGDAACASCHVFGDLDALAWDLGDPGGQVTRSYGPQPTNGALFNFQPFHPMKGPMTTQSLRGMAGQGPMHWRGDRNGGDAGHPESAALAFGKFNPAFVSLLGSDAPLADDAMQEFTDFVLTIAYPPNPIANLEGSRTPAEEAGRTVFTGTISDTESTCAGCHVLPFGSSGFMTFEAEPQEFKVAHFRNLYQKIGMFGTAGALGSGGTVDPFLGDQVRGFGFLHDGSIATVFNFLHAAVFAVLLDSERTDLEQFVLATDTGLAPIVGQQATANAGNWNAPALVARVQLLAARAAAGDCDLVVTGAVGGQARGWLANGERFVGDRAREAPVDEATLRAHAATPGQELTYTCVPPGAGVRSALDRDEDGALDGDERDLGSDPANAASRPGATAIRGTALHLAARRIAFAAVDTHGVPSGVTPPLRGTPGDPTSAGTTGGAVLTVYNAAGGSASTVLALPADGWHTVGRAAAPRGFRYSDRKRRRGPIVSVQVRSGGLVVRGGGKAWTYPLTAPAQQAVAVRLALGNGVSWCALFSDPKIDRRGKFVAVKATAAAVPCPPPS